MLDLCVTTLQWLGEGHLDRNAGIKAFISSIENSSWYVHDQIKQNINISVCRRFRFVRGKKKKSVTQTNSQCVNKQQFNTF